MLKKANTRFSLFSIIQ